MAPHDIWFPMECRRVALRRCRTLIKNNWRQAEKFGVKIDRSFTLYHVFVRDQGVCHICEKRVYAKDASIDHVKPLSKGGDHVPDNVKLSHLKCNRERRNRYEEGNEKAT